MVCLILPKNDFLLNGPLGPKKGTSTSTGTVTDGVGISTSNGDVSGDGETYISGVKFGEGKFNLSDRGWGGEGVSNSGSGEGSIVGDITGEGVGGDIFNSGVGVGVGVNINIE